PGGLPPHVPDDLTIPQFLLDSRHPLRPLNQNANPWLIEESTGRNVGFEEIRARTYGLANALSGRYKIRENDVVCIFSANHVDYPTAVWAIHRLGAVATCANPAYTAEELKYQIELAEANLILVHSENLAIAQDAARAANLPADRIVLVDSPRVPALQLHMNIDRLVQEGLALPPQYTERRLNPGEAKTKLALLSFSSGTTGRPKAVAIPHYALIANVIQMSTFGRVNEDYAPWEERRYRAGDVIYAVLPFYHIYGAVVILHFYLFCGYTLVINSRFNFHQMLKSIERYRINHLCIVPPMIVLFCKDPEVKKHDLSSIRFVMSGAAPLSAELTQQLVKVLPNATIGQAYGMTESCTTLTLRGVVCQGAVPSVALGYYKNPEATKETFGDGWLRTGDEVIINRDYETFVVDRRKEIFKVRGYQVAPAELEGHLLNHPEVTDTCVVGVADAYSGEVPFAFVVPSPTALDRIKKDPSEAEKIKAEIIKFVADAKVHYKRLAGGVEFVDAIPKNPSGKLLRRFLREKAKELRKAVPAEKAKL
ncbi:hypothetical protein EIP91_010839, partial [Steccherinum ochraceum]